MTFYVVNGLTQPVGHGFYDVKCSPSQSGVPFYLVNGLTRLARWDSSRRRLSHPGSWSYHFTT